MLNNIMDEGREHSREFVKDEDIQIPNMVRESLYLPVNGDYLPRQTQTVLFLCQYCGYDSFNICLIQVESSLRAKQCAKYQKPDCCHHRAIDSVNSDVDHLSNGQRESVGVLSTRQMQLVDESSGGCASTLDVKNDCDPQTDTVSTSLLSLSPQTSISDLTLIKNPEDMDWLAQQCQLPAIVGSEKQICYSGLSAVLRRIVKKGHEKKPQKKLEALLGFNQACLKKCSEVSPCTKLCEVDIYQGLQVNNAIPRVILELEKHLASPLVISSKFLGKKKNSAKLMIDQQDGKVPLGEIKASPVSEWRFFQSASNLRLCDKRQHKVAKNIYKKREINQGRKDGSDRDGESVSEGPEELEFPKSVRSHHETLKTLEAVREPETPNRDCSCDVQTSDNTPLHGQHEGTGSETLMAQRGPCTQPCSKQSTVLDPSSSAQPVRLFVEGLYVTLADFALFHSIHSYHLGLGKDDACLGNIPLVFRWYQRMWTVPNVRSCAERCGLREVVMSEELFQTDCTADEIKTEVKTEVTAEVKTEVKTEVKAGVKTEVKAEVKAEVKTGVKTEVTGSVNQDKLRSLHISQLPSVKVRVAEVLDKLEACDIKIEMEDFPCENIQLPWDTFPVDVNPSKDVSMDRARHKRQQIESLVAAVQMVANPGDVIVDFCSGGGHVGIVLAHCLPGCRIIMVENNEESVKRAEARVEQTGLDNIYSCQCNLNYFTGKFDIGVSLHACGVATDLVLGKCLRCRAAFVCSPCCYGSARNSQLIKYPRSQKFLASALTYDDHLLVGHVAERTSWNFETEMAKQGDQ